MKKITTIGMALLLGGIGFAANAQNQTLKPVGVYYYQGSNTKPDQLNIVEDIEYATTPGGANTYTYTATTNQTVNVIPNTIYVNFLNAPSTIQVKADSIPVTQYLNGVESSTDQQQPFKYIGTNEKGETTYTPAYVYLDAENGLLTIDYSKLSNWCSLNQSGATVAVTIDKGTVTYGGTVSAQNENAKTTIVIDFNNKYITPQPTDMYYFDYPYTSNWVGGYWPIPTTEDGSYNTDDAEKLTQSTNVKDANFTCVVTTPQGTTITVPCATTPWTQPANENSIYNGLGVDLYTTYVIENNGVWQSAKSTDKGAQTIISAFGYGKYTAAFGEGLVTDQNGKINHAFTATANYQAVQQNQDPVEVAIFPTQDGFTIYDVNTVNSEGITLVYQFLGTPNLTMNKYGASAYPLTITSKQGFSKVVNGESLIYPASVNGNYLVLNISDDWNLTAGDYTVTWNIGALWINLGTEKNPTWVPNAPITYNFTVVNPTTLSNSAKANANLSGATSYFTPVINGTLSVSPNPDDNVYVISDINEISFEWLNNQNMFLVNPDNAAFTLTTPKALEVYSLPLNQNYSYSLNTISYTSSGKEVFVADVADYNYNFSFNIKNYIKNAGTGKYQIFIPEGTFVNNLVNYTDKDGNKSYGQLNKGITITYIYPELQSSVVITPDPFYTEGVGTTGQNIYTSNDLSEVVINFGDIISEGQPQGDEEHPLATMTLNGNPIVPTWTEDALVLDLSALPNGYYEIVIPTGYVEIGDGVYNQEIIFSYAINDSNVEPIVLDYPYIQNGENILLNAADGKALGLGWDSEYSIQLNPKASYVTVNGKQVKLTASNLVNIPGLFDDSEGEPSQGPAETPVPDEPAAQAEEAPFYNALVVSNLLNGLTGEVTIEIPAGVVYMGNANDYNIVYSAPVTLYVNLVGLSDAQPTFEVSGTTIQAYWSVPVVNVNDTEATTPYIMNNFGEKVIELTPGYYDAVVNVANGYITRIDFGLLGTFREGLVPGEYTLVIPQGFATLRPFETRYDMINDVATYEFVLTEDYEIIGEGTTGINGINGSEVVEGVYNLQGVKMSNDVKSLAPGLYIINGKKVLVRK